jgi:hypothetical protein
MTDGGEGLGAVSVLYCIARGGYAFFFVRVEISVFGLLG